MADANVIETLGDYGDAVDLLEIQNSGVKVCLAGRSAAGSVYLQGDIVGSPAAVLIKAVGEGVPYLLVGGDQILFSGNWIRSQCLHDVDRLRVIDNLSAIVLSH